MAGVRSLIMSVGLVVGLAACSTFEDPEELTEDATARSLTAAVVQHLDRPLRAAAPLLPSDLDRGNPRTPEVADSTLAVWVVFDEEVGESHVQLKISPDLATYDEQACDDEGMVAYAAGCEETAPVEGAEQRLSWQAVDPEEDPGHIKVEFRRDERLVVVYYQGVDIPEDLQNSNVADLADALVALAADPAVGFKTTAALAEAGAAIDDHQMRDLYGQGDGNPPELGVDKG